MPTNKINKHDVDNTIFTENNLPRPDNLGEGVLPVNKGGTGVTAFTSGAALIGNGNAIAERTITNNTALTSAISRNTNLVTMNTLSYALGRTTNPTQPDTNYTTYMVRSVALVTAAPSSMNNGTIAFVYA